ncbi:MAG TPA: hypothetical protein ENI53_02950, partial [Thermoplasmatales archaeon]|nr:hypothetical protein [Thermoplasmatales archaeon]
SLNNLIYNNYFNNTVNAWDNGDNRWNISKTAGVNIVKGAWLGGNYWHDYEGNDTNYDDLGDTMIPYNCSGNIVNYGDYLPLLMPKNHAPVTPYTPSPANGASNVSADTNLSWYCYDPDGDNITYEVYLGKSLPPQKVADNVADTFYSPGILERGVTYYWRIIAWDEHGASSLSPIWNFVTKANTLPTISNPTPSDEVTSINPTLAVYVNDGDGDSMTVTFYDADDDGVIGTVEDVLPGNTASVPWQNLQYSTSYSWYVKVSDGITTITSPIWNFTTMAIPQYTLTVTVNPPNAGTVNPDGGTYNAGEIVTITAQANNNYIFSHWSGDASGTATTIQITMNSNKNIVANFILPNNPPSIEITEPAEGSVVAEEINIKGKAWDIDGNESIVKVEIRIDDGEWIVADGTNSWNYSWNTNSVENGIHKIYARAYDGIQYSKIVSINVTVTNIINHPPEIEITEPLNGDIVKGNIVIKGKAWDIDGNESIVKVEIRIDDGEWINVTGTLNWAYSLDTTKLSDGEHKIEARSYDGMAYSNIASIKIKVQNEEKKETSWTMLAGAIVVIVVVAGIAVAVWLIRRK